MNESTGETKAEGAIEILGLGLLTEQADLVQSFRMKADRLGIQLGWHYDLDLAWTASQLKSLARAQILDAGAGTGVLQWWLADQGAHVVSVDRSNRSDLSGRFRLAYRVGGLRSGDLYSNWQMVPRRLRERKRPAAARFGGAVRATATALLATLMPKAPGTVALYHHDLDQLPDLANNTFDAVVSVSALEHNEMETLALVIQELRRVLKPGGLLLATLAAAENRDWFHEPSRGWCLTETTLQAVFGLSADVPSNFVDYETILNEIRESEALRNHLSPAYFQSGDNGMPWGIWDPQYVPVGVRMRNS